MENRDCKLIFVGLGSPASLNEADIQVYLRDFLSNRKVVDLHPLIWKPILENFILKTRPKKLVSRYEKIWDGKEFILVKYTRELTEWFQRDFIKYDISYDYAFLYGTRTLKDLIAKEKKIGTKKLFIMPLFPQYCLSTWGIVEDMIKVERTDIEEYPEIKFLKPFYNEPCYIENICNLVKFKISDLESEAENIDNILVSFHGLPLKQVEVKKDPYLKQCQETFNLIQDALEDYVKRDDIIMTFQSKFGPGKWLGPSTENWLKKNSKEKNIMIVSPSFISDSLETLVEVKIELKEMVKEIGGHLSYVNCLNSNITWLNDYSKWIDECLKSDLF